MVVSTQIYICGRLLTYTANCRLQRQTTIWQINKPAYEITSYHLSSLTLYIVKTNLAVDQRDHVTARRNRREEHRLLQPKPHHTLIPINDNNSRMTEDTDCKTSSLFQGKQFWLSQNIPQRSRFKELITVCMLHLTLLYRVVVRRLTLVKSHGGIVRLQEKDADVKLVDHTKKNLPADT